MLHRPLPVFIRTNVEDLECVDENLLLRKRLEAAITYRKSYFMVVGFSVESSHDSTDGIKAIFFHVPLNIRRQTQNKRWKLSKVRNIIHYIKKKI